MKFHESLKLKRRAKKMKQKQLAKLVNVTSAAICNYEKGYYVPSLTVALKISKVLGFSLDELEIQRNVRIPIIGKLKAGASNKSYTQNKQD